MSKTVNTTAHLINGEWLAGHGSEFRSCEPGSGEHVWFGRNATDVEVDAAVGAARDRFRSWYAITLDERIQIARRYQELVEQRSEELALLISREVGKPLWESKTEAAAVSGKVQLAIDALQERRWHQEMEMSGFQAVTRYHPHGVLAVLGPFNFPAHLPNGHIVPAILAGNTIAFKPSEFAPAVGQWMLERWMDAGLPPGVINLVQGGRETGIALSHHPNIDGLLFTGSSRAGVALHQNFGGQPQKILALEMGGNNPLIIHEANDLEAAAYLTVLSAYLTAGQRCTCARRLILVEDQSNATMIEHLESFIDRLRVGFYSDQPEPFMGTVISPETGMRLLEAQSKLISAGGKPIVEMKSRQESAALLSPGLMDLTGVPVEDEELFGPFLSLYRVKDFTEALEVANDTRYGLSAGLISDNRELYNQFIHEIRAGVVNWNRQTTGASGKLPFGGCGLSGNHRPSGYFAADYCSFPVASLETEGLSMPENLMQGIDASSK